MFGRRVRTIFDAMLPRKLTDSYSRNETIRSLNVGDKVLVKSHLGPRRWEPAIIEQRIGNVLYRVRGAFGTWIRHINQIRRDQMMLNEVDRRERLPLELLVDSPPTKTPTDTHHHWSPRKSKRLKKQVVKLQVNPKKKSYFLKGGRCWVEPKKPLATSSQRRRNQ
uniref:SJCHGC06426 protein n=1 Tax=Schistosoma japonicum TaxID=6182 RepID=Q5DB15_SCHJA|nr:SJCHGC06426 protein [Schistosoma japonicum]